MTNEPPIQMDSGDTLSEQSDNEVHTPHQITCEESDDGLFAAIDCIGEESDEYWDVMAEQKIKEFESYRDSHPCIVIKTD